MPEVAHFYVEQNTAQTTTSSSRVTVSDTTILGASLAADTKYLIIARALFGVNDATDKGKLEVFTADDSSLGGTSGKSFASVEFQQTGSDDLKSYLFIHSYTTSSVPTDIQFGMRVDGGSTMTVDQLSLMLIDLDDLGSDNYFEDINAATGTELPTSEVVLAQIDAANLGTTEEWLMLGYAKIGVGSGGVNYEVRLWAADDEVGPDGSLVNVIDEEGEDGDEERMCGVVGRHKAITTAANAYIGAREDANNGNHTDEGSYLIAIKPSALGGLEHDYQSGTQAITSEATIATVGPYTPSTSGNHLIIGRTGTAAGTADGAELQLHLEDGTTETRTGDSTPTHDQGWDITKDAEPAFTMERISISAEKTYNLRATGGTWTAEDRWLLVLNLNLASDDDKSGSGAIVETHTVVGTGTSARSNSGAIAQGHSVVATGQKDISGTGSISHGHTVVATGVANELHSGSGAIVEGHTVVGVGDKNASGASAISHGHTVVGAGTSDRSSDGAIAQGHTVIGTGRKDASEAGGISQGHTVVATGVKNASGADSISHSHTVVATGVANELHSGSGVISQGHTVISTGDKTGVGEGSISHPHVVTSTGDKAALGSGSITQGHTVVGTGFRTEGDDRSGSGAIVETHTVVATGLKAGSGEGSISRGHTVVGQGDKGGLGTGSIVHGHTVVGTGVANELHSGSGAIVQSHTVVGQGNKTGSGEGSISHPHTVVGQGDKNALGSSNISHGHTVVATGVKFVGEEHSGSGAITETHTVVGVGVKQASNTGNISHPHTVIGQGAKVAIGTGNVVVSHTIVALGESSEVIVTETRDPHRLYGKALKRDIVSTTRDYQISTDRDYKS